MKVRCLFFGKGKELTNISEKEFILETKTNSTNFLLILEKEFPSLSQILDTCVLAVNQEYVDKGLPIALKEGDEIALIPPLSGG